MRLNFTKMHSLGNDFVVLDARQHELSLTATHIRHLANRRHGIGCDQVLILDPPKDRSREFAYRIYNADGQAVEQCGNGARCLARYAADHGGSGPELLAESPCGPIALALHEDDTVTVDMGPPRTMPCETSTKQGDPNTCLLEINHQDHSLAIVSMGNPHAILTVDSSASAPVHTLGPRIETHPKFPQHTNVAFMEIVTPRHIRLRVWERGVGETPGCGSGACAAIVAGRRAGQLEETVTVSLPGGDLEVCWGGQDNQSVLLRGSAEYSFEGAIDL